jgi:NADPH2:quinone reductase
MKAVVFESVGEPNQVLALADLPCAVPSATDLLVRVSASPIHPADLAFIRGKYRLRPQFPQVAGLEGAGVVVVAGASTAIAVGARVAFRAPGAWGEFALVPASRAIPVPDDVADELACQFTLNPVTAAGLLDEAGCASGDWIALTAAASTVSNLVGAIARHRRIGVIGLVRGDAGEGVARCTADHVVSSDDAQLAAKIVALTGGQKAAAVIDSVGGQLVATLFGCLAPGGRIIAYGVQDPGSVQVTNAMLIYGNVTWKGFGIDRFLAGQSEARRAAMHAELYQMIRDGLLPLPVTSRHTLASFSQALEADARQGRRGKVLFSG